MEASFELLDQEGADAITIRRIATRAGVSHAAPVNHFRDRAAIMTEIAVTLFEELRSEIRDELRKDNKTARERVLAFPETLIRYGLERPHRYRMLWRRDIVDNDDPRLAAAMDLIYDEWLEEIEVADLAKDVDKDTIAISIWSMAHGYISMRLDGNFEAATDDISGVPRDRAIFDLLLS